MKVTRLGQPQVILENGTGLNAGSRIPPGGTAGQVLTSNGSNGRYWGENVRRITSNGSNILASPDVNFAAGSNVIFSIASNTLSIHAVSGGGGGSALTVQDEGTPLATDATTLNFVGSGVTATGAGATKTITVSGGGGGFTQAFVGTTSIGGSTETAVNLRQYMKKVTLANDCLVTSVGAYVRQVNAGNVFAFAAAVLDDDANSPDHVIAINLPSNPTSFLSDSNGAQGDARWLDLAIGAWLTAGDYWITIEIAIAGADAYQIYYDAGGSDHYMTNAAYRITDAGWTTVTDSTRNYSIRANTIR